MEIKGDNFTLTLPDDPTVFDLLSFDGCRVEMLGKKPFFVLWECAKMVIDTWECELIPDHTVDLKSLNDRAKIHEQVAIIESVGVQVSEWRRSFEETPKN